MEELLTTRELADLLRLNEKKVYQLVREGGIPHVRITGKWLFPKWHVLRWLEENVQREKDMLIVGSDDILLGRLLAIYSREKFPEALAYYSPVGSLKGIFPGLDVTELDWSDEQGLLDLQYSSGQDVFEIGFLGRHVPDADTRVTDGLQDIAR